VLSFLQQTSNHSYYDLDVANGLVTWYCPAHPEKHGKVITVAEWEAFKKVEAENGRPAWAYTTSNDRDQDHLKYGQTAVPLKNINAAENESFLRHIDRDFCRFVSTRITENNVTRVVPAKPIGYIVKHLTASDGMPYTHQQFIMSSTVMVGDEPRTLYTVPPVKARPQLGRLRQTRLAQAMRDKCNVAMEINENGSAVPKVTEQKETLDKLRYETTHRSRKLRKEQEELGIVGNQQAVNNHNYNTRKKVTRTEEELCQDTADIKKKFNLKEFVVEIWNRHQEHATKNEITVSIIEASQALAKRQGKFSLAQVELDAHSLLFAKTLKAVPEDLLKTTLNELAAKRSDLFQPTQNPMLFTNHEQTRIHEVMGHEIQRHSERTAKPLDKKLMRRLHDQDPLAFTPIIEQTLDIVGPKPIVQIKETEETLKAVNLARFAYETKKRRVFGVGRTTQDLDTLKNQCDFHRPYSVEQLDALSTPPTLAERFLREAEKNQHGNRYNAIGTWAKILKKTILNKKAEVEFGRDDVIVISGANEIAVGRIKTLSDRILAAGAKIVLIDKPSKWASDTPSLSNCNWDRAAMEERIEQKQRQKRKRDDREQGHDR
jgi:hypothetical protein